MAYNLKDLKIQKLSVIGAGQIGPDICLHFAKVFWKNDVQLVLYRYIPAGIRYSTGKG